MEAAVIVNPSPYHRVEHMSQFVQGFVRAPVQFPSPHGIAYRFCGFVADCRSKPDEKSTLAGLRSPGPKRIAQEIKLLLRIISSLIIIFTVNNPRFLQMKLQPTFRKAPFNRHPKSFRFGFAPTVTYPIIGIPLKWNLRVLPLHPSIKRIMQKEIRKQRTDHPSLRRPFIPMYQAAIIQLHRGFQPSFDV